MTKEAHRIYADMNGVEPSSRNPGRCVVRLDGIGSLRALSNAGVVLREGLQLTVYESDDTEDVETTGPVFYDYRIPAWVVETTHENFRYIPTRFEPKEFPASRAARISTNSSGRSALAAPGSCIYRTAMSTERNVRHVAHSFIRHSFHHKAAQGRAN